MHTSELSQSTHGYGYEEKTKLPGLTFIFLLQLWLTAAVCLLSASFQVYTLLDPYYYFPFPWNILFIGLTLIMIFVGLLCVRAAVGITGRDASAPERCRFLLVLNLIAGFFVLAFSIWRAFQMGMGWDKGITLIIHALYALILCEAWRRYFGESSKVKAAFGKQRNPDTEELSASGEMGLIALLCWLGIAYRGIHNALYTVYLLLNAVEAPGNMTLHFSISCLVGITAPLLILYAIKAREGKRALVFWGLGLWLAASAVNYLIFTGGILMKNGFDTSVMLQAKFPSMINATEAIALAVWWYMAVSDKAKAWFAESTQQKR